MPLLYQSPKFLSTYHVNNVSQLKSEKIGLELMKSHSNNK